MAEKAEANGNTEKQDLVERAANLTGRAASLSDDVLKSVESGQRTAIDAVRKFVGAVDESMPAHGDDHPSRRASIVDAALEMADKLVKTQYEFIRSVVGSASAALQPMVWCWAGTTRQMAFRPARPRSDRSAPRLRYQRRFG
jgi:hypothetical protein